MDLSLLGLHHVTAISSDIRENYRFYTKVMGMRLVKRSVNQDDVSAYHLFYADAKGTPGTDLTFFDWQMLKEQFGTRSIVRTSLRVMGQETLERWLDVFQQIELPHGEITEIDGRRTLWFEDREGQRLALIDDEGKSPAGATWQYSPVEPEYQIRGLGPVMVSVPVIKPTADLLTKVLGMREVRGYPHPENAASRVHVFEMGGGGAHTEVHVAVQPDLPNAQQGAGGVHHVAFRTPDDQYEAWEARLNEMRVPNSGPIDRFWFRSLYLREPNGVLFEIATEGPGFTADEDVVTLGDRIVLPPFLEHQRSMIVSRLKRLE
jgi:glyoxalase family protein